MRPLVIANPAARRGRAESQLPGLMAELTARVGPVDLETTTQRGHAEQLAAQAAADGRELVISVGGDGLLNEVVNGLLTARRGEAAAPLPAAELPRLGILATGTGGDFGRSLGIDQTPEAYLEAIGRGREKLVDAGLARFAPRRRPGRPGASNDAPPAAASRRRPRLPVAVVARRFPRPRRNGPPLQQTWPADAPQGSSLLEQRYFLNVLSAGIGGLVDRYAAAMPAAMNGRLAYGLATLAAIVLQRRQPLALTVTQPDGATSVRAFDGHALVIGNGHTFGGGMRIAPHARPDDGLLDVVTFETSGKLTLFRHFLTIYAGTHLTKTGVRHFSCARIEVTSEAVETGARTGQDGAGDLFPLDIDGDNLGDLPLSVEVVPAALRVLA